MEIISWTFLLLDEASGKFFPPKTDRTSCSMLRLCRLLTCWRFKPNFNSLNVSPASPILIDENTKQSGSGVDPNDLILSLTRLLPLSDDVLVMLRRIVSSNVDLSISSCIALMTIERFDEVSLLTRVHSLLIVDNPLPIPHEACCFLLEWLAADREDPKTRLVCIKLVLRHLLQQLSSANVSCLLRAAQVCGTVERLGIDTFIFRSTLRSQIEQLLSSPCCKVTVSQESGNVLTVGDISIILEEFPTSQARVRAIELLSATKNCPFLAPDTPISILVSFLHSFCKNVLVPEVRKISLFLNQLFCSLYDSSSALSNDECLLVLQACDRLLHVGFRVPPSLFDATKDQFYATFEFLDKSQTGTQPCVLLISRICAFIGLVFSGKHVPFRRKDVQGVLKVQDEAVNSLNVRVDDSILCSSQLSATIALLQKVEALHPKFEALFTHSH